MADQTENVPAEPDIKPIWAFVVLAVVLLLVAFLRIRLLPVELERDEGEYAYMGQLMLDGIPPYGEAANMKWPGTYAVYAAGMAVFGETKEGVRLTLLLANAISIVLVFFIGRRIGGNLCAAVSAGAFGVITVTPFMMGFAAHATHFVVLFALAAMLALDVSLERSSLFGVLGSGILFGLAALMKQPGLAFAGFGAALILQSSLQSPSPVKRIAWGWPTLAVGVLIPIGLMVLSVYSLGVFDSFWFWTIEYARTYGNSMTTTQILDKAWESTPFMFITRREAILAFAIVGVTTPFWSASLRSRWSWTIALPVFSVLALLPGFAFRHHYYLLLTPATALLAGMGVVGLYRTKPTWIANDLMRDLLALAAALAVLSPMPFMINTYLMLPVANFSRQIWNTNPFNESPTIAAYIREHTDPNDRVAIIGSEPEILFLADRRSATQFIYTYAFLEDQPYAEEMQKKMIEEVEAASPKMLVFVNNDFSWGGDVESVEAISSWVKEYTANYYDLVGVVVTKPIDEESEFYWDADVAKAPKDAENVIEVYRRRDTLSDTAN